MKTRKVVKRKDGVKQHYWTGNKKVIKLEKHPANKYPYKTPKDTDGKPIYRGNTVRILVDNGRFRLWTEGIAHGIENIKFADGDTDTYVVVRQGKQKGSYAPDTLRVVG